MNVGAFVAGEENPRYEPQNLRFRLEVGGAAGDGFAGGFKRGARGGFL
jgi:hypothetical protein